MGIIIALLCLGIGFIWYVGLAPSLPKELSFLKMGTHVTPTTNATRSSAEAVLPPLVVTSSAWNMSARGADIEMSREFSTGIKGATQTYDRPAFYLTCHQSKLYARIDSRLHTRGETTAEVIWQDAPQTWIHGDGQNIFAPETELILHSFRGQKEIQVSLDFNEEPRQSFVLKLDGFEGALTQLKQQCFTK